METWRRWQQRQTRSLEQAAYYRVAPRHRLLVGAVYIGLIALLALGMYETHILHVRAGIRLRLDLSVSSAGSSAPSHRHRTPICAAQRLALVPDCVPRRSTVRRAWLLDQSPAACGALGDQLDQPAGKLSLKPLDLPRAGGVRERTWRTVGEPEYAIDERVRVEAEIFAAAGQRLSYGNRR